MDIEDRTRERAYQLWQQAGCPHGRSEEFWLAAVESIATEAAMIGDAAAMPPGNATPAGKAVAARRRGASTDAAPIVVVGSAAAAPKSPKPARHAPRTEAIVPS